MKRTRKRFPQRVFLTQLIDPVLPYEQGYRLCTKQSVTMQLVAIQGENAHRLRYPEHFEGKLRKLIVLEANITDWTDVTDEFLIN